MSTPTPSARRPADWSAFVSRPGSLADPENLTPAMRRRRAVSLVVLTLVAPGSAQLVAGSRALGRAAIRTWLSVIAALLAFAALFLVKRSWAIGLLGRSWFLLLMTVALAALAVGWAVLLVDSVRLARLRLLPPTTRRLVLGLMAAALLVTSGPLLLASRNTAAARGVVASVFGGNSAVEASDGRYNILLLGGDSGASRMGTRPDSITVVSVDADTGKPVMFGFARDTEYITFRPGSVMARLMPQGWMCGKECLLNGLYTWGQDHKAEFPAGTVDAGIVATTDAVEALSGLDVQYYVLIDLKGFTRLIDAVGGLEVDVKRRTPIGGETSKVSGYIEPGRQVLDGYHALWYARSREGSDNYERMARQRCVMDAMLHQLSPTTVVTKFQNIAAAGTEVVKTDIPESELGTLADLGLKAKGQKITSVNFVPPLMKPWNYSPDFVRDKVASTIEASAAAPASPAPSATASGSGARTTPAPAATGGAPATDDLSVVCSI